MPIDKPTLAKLTKFAKVFADARDRDAKESDTVMYLIKFFEEVLEYDPLTGEIAKEVEIDDRYCDFAVRLDPKGGKPAYLIEAKPCSMKVLKEKHIEQAENYASRAGIFWVLLTNGIIWQLYHLTFTAAEGIKHDKVFDLNFIEELEKRPDFVWDTLSVLSKRNVREESLDTYYEQQKLLSPKNIVNLLLSEEVLMKLRQELNRKAPARLDLTAVFNSVVHVLSPEAVACAGDIEPPSKKRHRRKRRKEDGSEEESGADGSQNDEAEETPNTSLANPPTQVPGSPLAGNPPSAPP